MIYYTLFVYSVKKILWHNGGMARKMKDGQDFLHISPSIDAESGAAYEFFGRIPPNWKRNNNKEKEF